MKYVSQNVLELLRLAGTVTKVNRMVAMLPYTPVSTLNFYHIGCRMAQVA